MFMYLFQCLYGLLCFDIQNIEGKDSTICQHFIILLHWMLDDHLCSFAGLLEMWVLFVGDAALWNNEQAGKDCLTNAWSHALYSIIKQEHLIYFLFFTWLLPVCFNVWSTVCRYFVDALCFISERKLTNVPYVFLFVLQVINLLCFWK